jgi:hypothetical protein
MHNCGCNTPIVQPQTSTEEWFPQGMAKEINDIGGIQ